MRLARTTVVAVVIAASAALPAAPASAFLPIACITTVVLPTGQLGSVYQARITTTVVPPAAFSIAATGLPSGLSMSTTGLITGTPSAAGTFHPKFVLGSGVLCGTKILPLTVRVDQHARVAYWRPTFAVPTDHPQDVPGLTDVTSEGTDDKVGVFLRGDGTVWLWSDYSADTVADANPPVQLNTPSGITQVTGDGGPVTMGPMSDYDSGFALRYNGTVWGWGDNTYGQLGHGVIGGQDFVPKPVTGLRNVVAISSAYRYAYALTSDGKVWGWGDNSGEVLGANPAVVSTPVLVPGMTDIVAIATGEAGYGLRANGTVVAIGFGGSGALGQPPTTAVQTAVIPGLTGVTAIAACGSNCYALAGGHVFSWGPNYQGELGNGSSALVSMVPVQVSGLSGVSAIGATLGSYAIVNGRLWAWGLYDADGTFGSHVPVLSPLPGVLSVSGTAALHRLVTIVHPPLYTGSATSWEP
jgi:hypothetical protein